MVFVKKQPGQSDDQLIRNFTNKVRDNDIIKEVRARQHYMSKTEKKKYEQQEARRMRRRVA